MKEVTFFKDMPEGTIECLGFFCQGINNGLSLEQSLDCDFVTVQAVICSNHWISNKSEILLHFLYYRGLVLITLSLSLSLWNPRFSTNSSVVIFYTPNYILVNWDFLSLHCNIFEFWVFPSHESKDNLGLLSTAVWGQGPCLCTRTMQKLLQWWKRYFSFWSVGFRVIQEMRTCEDSKM